MNDFFKAIRSYLLEYLPKQRCCSENTIKSYRNGLNLLVEYLRTEKQLAVSHIDFDLFNRKLILEYLDWLENVRNCGATTRNQRLMVIRAFFKYAGEMCIRDRVAGAILRPFLNFRKVVVMKKYRKFVLTLCFVLLVSLTFGTTAYAAPTRCV